MTSEVETRSISALWYAWGQIDSGIHPGLTLDDGWAFQRICTDKAEAFYVRQEIVSLASLLQEWANFVTARKAAHAAALLTAPLDEVTLVPVTKEVPPSPATT